MMATQNRIETEGTYPLQTPETVLSKIISNVAVAAAK